MAELSCDEALNVTTPSNFQTDFSNRVSQPTQVIPLIFTVSFTRSEAFTVMTSVLGALESHATNKKEEDIKKKNMMFL